MNLLTTITQALAAASMLAFIWLTVRAFRTHFGWGLGVLLLSPFSATAFGLKYWNNEKKPFLVYILTTLGYISLAAYLFSTWGGWEVLRTSALVETGLQNRNLSSRNAEAFMKANLAFIEKSGIEINNPQLVSMVQQQLDLETARQAELEAIRKAQEERDNLSASQMNKKIKPQEERYRLAYRTIRVTDAKKYVGATVKITRKNAQEKEYRLIAANGNSLKLTQRTRNGSYSFSLRNNDIEKLRILTKQPY
ncbi:MAG: hypothetical protein OEU91_05990 [Gammaproteobacteria bacterium]|nr:hypothetical protein [Gammaproteobacteria bacterium]